MECLRGTRSLHSKLFASACGTMPAAIAQMGVVAASHRLHAAVIGMGPEVVVFCTRCGYYMTSLPRELAKPCGAPAKTRQRTLNMISRGRHPKPSVKTKVGVPWPLEAFGSETPQGSDGGLGLAV